MKTVLTQSGSTYEIDQENQLIRRLSGQRDPTKSQGPDGQWKPYYELFLVLGYSMLVSWDKETPNLGTRTSRVIDINDGLMS